MLRTLHNLRTKPYNIGVIRCLIILIYSMTENGIIMAKQALVHSWYRNSRNINSYVKLVPVGILKLALQHQAPTYKVQTSLIQSRKYCSLRYTMTAKFPRGQDLSKHGN